MSAIAAMHKGMTRVVAGILIGRERRSGGRVRIDMDRRVRTPFGEEEYEKERRKNTPQLPSPRRYRIKASHRGKYSYLGFEAQEIGPTAAFAHSSMQGVESVNHMKTLYILRHAKSSWDDASLADFDRPLNGRGERAAPFMGKLMKKTGLLPDVVLSSPAARAKSTARLAVRSADLDAEIKFDDRIYEASPQSLRQVVSEVDNSNLSAMVVGHNPGIEGFIRFLTGENESMPTAALAVIELDIKKWDEVDTGCGELQALFRPRDEMKAS